MLTSPEAIAAVVRHLQTQGSAIDEAAAVMAMGRLRDVWDQLFPAEQHRGVTSLGEPEAFAEEAADAVTAQDTPLLRALGLAHHWQRLLDEGRVSGLREIAQAEGMDIGRASRIMRLNQLAPEVIEAAVRHGRLAVGLSELLGWFPERWDAQQAHLSAAQLPFSAGLPVRRSTS